ncbi:addiction module toxin, HicA family [Henriciella barbarensis]|uniref:Addiction module toxin, HicA family n=1 Tax=Henriciella barbarensis TaxID=86342 RepID=A0A399QVM8_9PROT|nr:addiction module toxin, HicA family [Henriciella barbarensis]
MAVGFYREVTKHIKKAGYAYDGNFKGSHERWKHKKTGHLVEVPFNLKSRHTANGILSSAGVKKKL